MRGGTKETAKIATTMRSALYGQATSIAKKVITVTGIDVAVRIYNEAMDRILSILTQGLKAMRQRSNQEPAARSVALTISLRANSWRTLRYLTISEW